MAANPKTFPTQQIQISITGTTPDPKSAKIDSDGSIQFTSDDECTIEWKDEKGKGGTFWSSQPGKVTKGVNGVQGALPSADHHTLTYTLKNDTQTQGGGTIKVGS